MRVEQIESDGLEQAVRLSGLRVVTLASLVFEITNDSRRRALGMVSHFTSDWSLREAALRRAFDAFLLQIAEPFGKRLETPVPNTNI